MTLWEEEAWGGRTEDTILEDVVLLEDAGEGLTDERTGDTRLSTTNRQLTLMLLA